MRAIFLLLFLVAGANANPAAKVYGKIQVVDAFEDYRVKIVKSHADLRVLPVKFFPNKPGKWQFVKAFPAYRIKFVSSGEDFTIEWVNSFPGPRK